MSGVKCKCDCGVLLFSSDLVGYDEVPWDGDPISPCYSVVTNRYYRCPKCHHTVKVKVE